MNRAIEVALMMMIAGVVGFMVAPYLILWWKVIQLMLAAP